MIDLDSLQLPIACDPIAFQSFRDEVANWAETQPAWLASSSSHSGSELVEEHHQNGNRFLKNGMRISTRYSGARMESRYRRSWRTSTNFFMRIWNLVAQWGAIGH